MTKYRVFLLTNILFSLLKMVLPAIGISSKIHSKKLLPKFLDNIYQVVERNQVQTKYILNYFQILSSILSNRYYYSSYFFVLYRFSTTSSSTTKRSIKERKVNCENLYYVSRLSRDKLFFRYP